LDRVEHSGGDFAQRPSAVSFSQYIQAGCLRSHLGCKPDKLAQVGWLLIWPALVLGGPQQAGAQNADLAGVVRGDRWEYEATDEITGDVAQSLSTKSMKNYKVY
jgi:hypothetical protein